MKCWCEYLLKNDMFTETGDLDFSRFQDRDYKVMWLQILANAEKNPAFKLPTLQELEKLANSIEAEDTLNEAFGDNTILEDSLDEAQQMLSQFVVNLKQRLAKSNNSRVLAP